LIPQVNQESPVLLAVAGKKLGRTKTGEPAIGQAPRWFGTDTPYGTMQQTGSFHGPGALPAPMARTRTQRFVPLGKRTCPRWP
jgi:hypothetical protein